MDGKDFTRNQFVLANGRTQKMAEGETSLLSQICLYKKHIRLISRFLGLLL